MFSTDFPLTFPAGLHARPLAHLGQLGLMIDGKPMRPDNPQMAEYEAPQSGPERVVRLSVDTSGKKRPGRHDWLFDQENRAHEQRLLQYAKATIQSGDGPFRHVAPQMTGDPAHVQSAMQSLESNPDWQPYIKLARRESAKDGNTGCRDCGNRFNGSGQCPYCGSHNTEPAGPGNDNKFPGTKANLTKDNDEHCPDCGAKMSPYDLNCPNCGSGNNGEEPDYDAMSGGYDNPRDDWRDHEPSEHEESAKTSDWHEAGPMQQFQMERGDFAGAGQGTQGTSICPACGTLNQPGATQCAKCGAKLGLVHPSLSGGPSNAYSNPYTGNPAVASALNSEMSKWHLADLVPEAPGQQAQMDTQNGQFNDHRDVGGMSPEQSVGHERLVNIVVDEMNQTISGGGVIDATLINNLVQWLVDKFGQDADSAQAIVDAATKQAQTSDGRLDNTPVVPDPAEQAIQPAQGDVVSDPSQTQNNGAFAHVRTPSGRVGHITERWEDMYGEKWAMVVTAEGYKENAYEDELVTEDEPIGENSIEELHAFIDSMEPATASLASIKARMANVRILKQEIRRHMNNPRLSYEQRIALDKMDGDASLEMLELTDAVPELAKNEQSYLESQPNYNSDFAEHVSPTLHGAEELSVDEPPAPEWTNEALEAYAPEEAEIMVSELSPHIRSNPEQLEAVAASYIDRLTAGHSSEDRAIHRSRFVNYAKTIAADYAVNDEPDTIEDTTDYDGPAEGIFA